MENRRRQPEGNDSHEDDSAAPDRRGLYKFLARFRQQEMLDHKEEQDDDEESEDKPKKKWRRLFKKVFPSIVERPEGPQKQERKWFLPPEMVVHAASGSEGADVPEGQQNVESAPDLSGEVQSNVEGEHAEATETENQDAEHITELPSTIETAPKRDDIEPVIAYNRQESALSKGDYPTSEQQRTTPATEKEVVIERGVGSALPVALVGLEYLARKNADRKLEEKFTKRTEYLQKEVKEGEIARRQLDTLVQQNKEQLKELKKERGMAPEKSTTVQRPEVPRFNEARRMQAEIEPREQAAEKKVERLPARPEQLRVDTKKPELKSRQHMEQVADAAEHDVPVERVFERSHEVKDDKSTPVTAASVGAIMASQAAQQRGFRQTDAGQYQAEDPRGLPVIDDNPGTEAYRQAAKAGFWAAIAIIIFGTIAYLMIK